MVTKEKAYFISYWPGKSIVNPGDSLTYYKVKSISEQNAGSVAGIPLTRGEYNRWVAGITPYHYINDVNYTIDKAYVDNSQKIIDEEAGQTAKKENDVFSLWNNYLNLDSVDSDRAADYKTQAREKALFLPEEGQKAFIVKQMMHLKTKIEVLTDLSEDTTALELEYDDLVLDYNSFIPTT